MKREFELLRPLERSRMAAKHNRYDYYGSIEGDANVIIFGFSYVHVYTYIYMVVQSFGTLFLKPKILTTSRGHRTVKFRTT